mgnify:CR=1 FL=1
MDSSEIRLYLNAALRNILAGCDVEKNVHDAEESMRAAFEIADGTSLHIGRGRDSSLFLREQRDYDRLVNLGNYSTRVARNRAGRVVSFSDKTSDRNVRFIFKKGDYSAAESIGDAIKSMGKYQEEEFKHATLAVILDVSHRKKEVRNPNETLLGENSFSLRGYGLRQVDVGRTVKLLGIINSRRRHTVYRA